jgi:S1-C subfamily serine protease
MLRRPLPLILPLLLALAGCFHEPTPAQRAASFRPLESVRVDDLSLADYTARRTAYLLSTAAGDFVTDRPGHLVLTNVRSGLREVRLYTGTAVILTRDGYLLTAAHCADTPNLTVIPAYVPPYYPNLGALHPRVVWIGRAGDPLLDLALLKVDAPFLASFTWADDASLQPHTPVALAGIDLTDYRLRFSYAAGQLTDPDYDRPPHRSHAPPIRALAHSAPLRRGDSGGPLLTPDGRLAAINVAVRYGLGPQFSVSLRPDPAWLDHLIAADRAAQATLVRRE